MITCLWYTHVPNLGSGVQDLDLDMEMCTCLWFTQVPNFALFHDFEGAKNISCHLSPDLGLWRTSEVSDRGLTSSSRFWFGHWSLIYQWSEFWLSILILKVQRTSMSFKSSFWALEDAGGSWLGIGIFILIWIWSLDTPTQQVWALYLDFEGAKNIQDLQILIWGFGGCWMFLIGVWHLDIDFYMFTGLWYTHDPNLGSLSWFWRCKEHPFPWSPHLGL